LDAQRTAVASYIDGMHGQLIAEYTEIEHATRRGNDRPVLAEALKQCRIAHATLLIAKLDRLARNVHFVSGLMESNIEFIACDFPQANRLTLHILSAVAEYEAHMISERTKIALAAAKRKGVVLGGVRDLNACHKGARQSAKVRAQRARRNALDLISVTDEIKGTGATSLRQIAEQLNKRGVTARRGGQWSATQVSRMIAAR